MTQVKEANLLNIFDGPANARLNVISKLLAQKIGNATYPTLKPHKVSISGEIDTDESIIFKALGFHVKGSFYIELSIIDENRLEVKMGPNPHIIMFTEKFDYQMRGNHKIRIFVDTEDRNGNGIDGHIDIAELRYGKTGTKYNPDIKYKGKRYANGVVLRPVD